MTGGSIVRYLKTWAFKRQEQQRRLNELRRRDGDNCRRCRRPLRFDLPEGHDRAPTVQAILSDGAASALDNLCLCHTRCNAALGDNTADMACHFHFIRTKFGAIGLPLDQVYTLDRAQSLVATMLTFLPYVIVAPVRAAIGQTDIVAAVVVLALVALFYVFSRRAKRQGWLR